MRPPTLQYFYLQKPLTLLLFIAIVSTLLWIGMGEFYTKGEPREASVAVSMVEKGEWVLPTIYADEITYKPPLTHWLIAVFSLPKGEVTPFTSRLPSALAFISLIGVCFVFFGKRIRFQEAFLACLILLTSFEFHRSAMTSRVDMVLTALMVFALISLFRWEERKQLKGFPLLSVFMLGLAALAKGPVGIVLPLLVFGTYLLLLKYNFWKIIGKFLPVFFCSLILPGIWYYLAYREGGQAFLDVVWAENVGRFLGTTSNLHINYNLGHEFPVWYVPLYILAGFMPWTLLVFFSLFGLKYTFKIPQLSQLWDSLLSMDKVKLFSLVAAVVIFIFFCIPLSKRSVYLMPAYPFIAIFLSQYILYLTEYKRNVTRVFSILIGFIGCVVAIICLLTVVTHIIDPVQLIGLFSENKKLLSDVAVTWEAIGSPKLLYFIILSLLLFALYVLFYQLRRKINLKILYSTVGVYLAINLVLDGIILPAFKDGISMKPFAMELKESYPINSDNVYVMNNLMKYANMYGMNFYLHNSFHNFEKELPNEGFFLVGITNFEIVSKDYMGVYDFSLLRENKIKCRDGEPVIQFYSFKKIKPE